MPRMRYANGDALIRYPEDVERLRLALAEEDLIVLPTDIQLAYSAYSDDDWAAGWMDLDTVTLAAAVIGVKRYLVEDSPCTKPGDSS